ncbi:MAG: polyphosphate polymerase domain-containing protein [Planctomycetes bacterium]|jgi:SPX domain protein involved in polyphosphate accumulation|nr:polyphosphate polymerase domain-containing protein [Planctomycetota bacterium]
MQQFPRDLKQHTRSGADLYGLVRRARSPRPLSSEPSPADHSSTLLAKRYELKYRVPESTAIAIRSYVQGYLKMDKYAVNQPNHQYPICSLYLDSPRFDLFHETVLDKCNRFKLRVRGYDDDHNSPVFFEIKRKLNRIIYKSRARVAKEHLAPILNGSYVPQNLPEKDRQILQQFMHYCQYLQARPVALIRYMREAYENQTDSKVRITFDRHLYCKFVNNPVFTMNGQGWQPVPIDFVILEIKFTINFPLWLKDLVRMFDLTRESVSKYCSSVRMLVPNGTAMYRLPSLWNP